jgi:hypothetical protein
MGLGGARRARELGTRLLVNLGRLALAVGLTAGLMFAAVGALYATSAPRWVSLLVEPVSLLLLPGVLLGTVVGHSKDVAPDTTIAVCVAFYVGFVYAGLLWLGRGYGWGRRRRGSR